MACRAKPTIQLDHGKSSRARLTSSMVNIGASGGTSKVGILNLVSGEGFEPVSAGGFEAVSVGGFELVSGVGFESVKPFLANSDTALPKVQPWRSASSRAAANTSSSILSVVRIVTLYRQSIRWQRPSAPPSLRGGRGPRGLRGRGAPGVRLLPDPPRARCIQAPRG